MHASTSCVFRKQAEIDPTVEDAPVKAAKFALRLVTVSIFLEDVLSKLCHVLPHFISHQGYLQRISLVGTLRF